MIVQLRAIAFAFLKLGLTSFGGPIAHIGCFRTEFVIRRKWITEALFSELVALCQFLPGPTSSQIGFLIGLIRGGPLGGLAAFVAFTTPSAVALACFAYGVLHFGGSFEIDLFHGLKLVAVVIVAQAVWGMARTLAPDRTRMTIAVLSTALIILSGAAMFQLIAIACGGLLGLLLCRHDQNHGNFAFHSPIGRSTALVFMALFGGLLFGLPLIATLFPSLGFVAKFYHAGALVFGGGHVVLPLLEQEFVSTGLIDKSRFLEGYGAAQAVPGPLFTFAGYLGALASNGPGGLWGALIGTISIFLPGLMIAIAILPFWTQLRGNSNARAAIHGANAAVVGLLGAALYQPIWTSSILRPVDFLLVVAGYVALIFWRLPVWALVILLPSALVLKSLFGS